MAENSTVNIWNIIATSSLIASFVTAILGIIRDVFLERYRFKRQSESGYVQSQIQIYSQLYFFLNRLKMRLHIELMGDLNQQMVEITITFKKTYI